MINIVMFQKKVVMLNMFLFHSGMLKGHNSSLKMLQNNKKINPHRSIYVHQTLRASLALNQIAADAYRQILFIHFPFLPFPIFHNGHAYIHQSPLSSFHINLVLDRITVVDSETLGRKDDVELELAGSSAAGALVLAGGRVVLDGFEIDDEVVLDGEDGVGGEPGVVFGVDLGDDGLVVFMGDLF